MAPNRPRRRTRQRQAIVEELAKLKSHPTAADLHEILRRRFPSISLGTVYRNLELLSEWGEIQKIQPGPEKARFDADTRRHDHVRCVRCGRVADVPGDPLVFSPPEAEDIGGFRIIGHRLEYVGVCPACQEAKARLPADPAPDKPPAEHDP